MRGLGIIVGSAGLILGLGTASSWATGPSLPNNTAYVDGEFGTDSSTCGNALLGASFADTATGPCQTLNQALANLPTTGGNVFIVRGGQFGPIILTAGVSINGPDDRSAVITWNPSTVPGCLGALPPSCNGGASATYAVDIQAGSTNTVKLKNVIISNSSPSRMRTIPITGPLRSVVLMSRTPLPPRR